MSVEAFLNPVEEAIQGLENTSSIEEEIAAQFDIQEDHELEEVLKESVASCAYTGCYKSLEASSALRGAAARGRIKVSPGAIESAQASTSRAQA
jgi:hypothetical protein